MTDLLYCALSALNRWQWLHDPPAPPLSHANQNTIGIQEEHITRDDGHSN